MFFRNTEANRLADRTWRDLFSIAKDIVGQGEDFGN